MHHVSDRTINQSISATQVRAAQADAPSLEAKSSAPEAGGIGQYVPPLSSRR
jgi:hypothetical protein